MVDQIHSSILFLDVEALSDEDIFLTAAAGLLPLQQEGTSAFSMLKDLTSQYFLCTTWTFVIWEVNKSAVLKNRFEKL